MGLVLSLQSRLFIIRWDKLDPRPSIHTVGMNLTFISTLDLISQRPLLVTLMIVSVIRKSEIDSNRYCKKVSQTPNFELVLIYAKASSSRQRIKPCIHDHFQLVAVKND